MVSLVDDAMAAAASMAVTSTKREADTWRAKLTGLEKSIDALVHARFGLDPNVLVSAAISDGISRRVVQLAAAGGFRMVACPHLLDKLHRVLQHEKSTKYRTREELDRFERDVGLLAVTVPDPEVIEAVANDPDDDYLVALARERGAELVCSGDHDFDDVTWPAIVTPGRFVRRLTTGA